jgi:hypothetical protein
MNNKFGCFTAEAIDSATVLATLQYWASHQENDDDLLIKSVKDIVINKSDYGWIGKIYYDYK